MSSSASSSLSATIAHAIAFLTRPLTTSCNAATLIKLQYVLEANLTALYAPTWVVSEPLRGSGRRCLSLSPECLPPRPIYSACIAANVQWFDWIAALGGRDFDLLVDPGCVSVRFDSQIVTVWADEIPSPTAPAQSSMRNKTIAQQLLEDDTEEDEALFVMIADEVKAPTWMTPVTDAFPRSTRSTSPLSEISRSSSRSSNSSSGFSYESSSSMTSASVFSSSATSAGEQPKLSRRERARQARVYVDTTKTDVTPYDGGKTTVLTGGVMLGGGASGKVKQAVKAAAPTSDNWRSLRA